MSRSRRRWFHFSLRSLLGVVLLAAVALALYRQFWLAHRRQREFLAVAEEAGAYVAIRPWRAQEPQEWDSGSTLGWMDGVEEVWLFRWGWHRADEKDRLDCGFANEPNFGLLLELIRNEFYDPAWESVKQEKADACLSRLGDLSTLRRLSLRRGSSDASIGDKQLAHLRGSFSLARLELRNTEVSDEGLAHLARLRRLTYLGLGRTNITSSGLAHLRGLSKLETLDLGETGIGDDAWEQLTPLTALKHLFLDETGVADVRPPPLPSLEYLNLATNRVTSLRLDGCENLQVVSLQHTGAGDHVLSGLSGLGNLTRLGLIGTRVTGAGLAHLRNLPRLAELELDNRTITAEGIEHLKAMPTLKALLISRRGSDESRIDVLSSRLPPTVEIREDYSK
jgi:hypothetical protein